VGSVQTAEDLTAVVFQHFLEALQTAAGPEHNLRAWLYRVAHNLIVDHYRRRQHRQHLPLKDTLIMTGDNPEQTADKALMAEQLREALGHLTPEQQQVISLKFLEGFSNVEVAAVMEKPVGAVKSLQHRGLATLQRLLSPSEREDEPARMEYSA
jgi:RNA polymerase sigma-70 factor (ECF subfamily)